MCCDENYAMPLAVTLHSMLMRLRYHDAVHVYVLSSGLAEQTKDRLRRSAQVCGLSVTLEFVEVDSASTQNLPVSRHLSVATYMRLLLPVLLPLTVRKVVYLDCDLLITEDISELWNEDISAHSLLAVQDMLIARVSHNEFGLYNWKALGYPVDHPYFNAGLLVMNLERWRSMGLSDLLLTYIETHGENLRFCDQDALNAILGRDWKPLSLKWNTFPLILGSRIEDMQDGPARQLVRDHYSEVTRRAAVYHFVTHLKPWIPGRRLLRRRQWMDALLRSGYFSAFELAEWGLDWAAKHYFRGAMLKLRAARFGVVGTKTNIVAKVLDI